METVAHMNTGKNIGYIAGALTVNLVLWVFIFAVAKALI
jgi:hypothetical protein